MKLRHLLPPALIAAVFALTASGRVTTPNTTSAHQSSTDAACPSGYCLFMAAATTSAPTQAPTCVVSGEKLGSMGKPIEYVHKEAGKPDRIVLLCCKSCIEDFEKEPAKYLAKLDAAAAAAKK